MPSLGHSKLSFKLLCGDTRPSSREKERSIEPRAHRGGRLVKDSASGRGNLITAAVALVNLTLGYAVKIVEALCIRGNQSSWESDAL